MEKNHVVRLTKRQHEIAQRVIDELDGSLRKVKRVHLLLKADDRMDGWLDGSMKIKNSPFAHWISFQLGGV